VTARDVLGAAVDAVAAAGVESPRLDAELLVADALGVDRAVMARLYEDLIETSIAYELTEFDRTRC
jgi:hypothetical protein